MTPLIDVLRDEFFLTGTAAEVIAAVNLDSRVIGDGTPGPVTERSSLVRMRLKEPEPVTHP